MMLEKSRVMYYNNTVCGRGSEILCLQTQNPLELY